MKKYLLLLCLLSILPSTLSPLSRNCIRNPVKKTLDEKYEIAITQLQKHLESSALTPQDRSDLINKLVSYFAPLSTKKSEIFLKNKQAQVIYGAVIKSYNELKSAQNHEKSGDKAKKFAEQAIGKIVLYRKPNNQKARLKK